jgi:hypothetical protein
MPLKIRNLDFLRNLSVDASGEPQAALARMGQTISQLGPRLYEALTDLRGFHQNIAQQTNASPTGEPQPPPALNGFKVTADANGYHHVSFTDNNELYRGVRYYALHADNPQMRGALPTQASGTELRNHMEHLGPATRYWMGYSAYPWSAPNQPLYHGGAQPIAVTGGSGTGAPEFQPSQGMGTGTPGVALSGPGPVAFRSATGAPPVKAAG